MYNTCIVPCILKQLIVPSKKQQLSPSRESNTVERSTTLNCSGTWLSFLIQLAVAALIRKPSTERGVCSVLSWHEAVSELRLVFTQLLKSYAPISLVCPLVEPNTLELSNGLFCHRTWLSFLMQLVVAALLRNPKPEPGFAAYCCDTRQLPNCALYSRNC